MILVIGKENCNLCKMTQNILKSKNIEFKYSLLEDLEDSKKYIELASKVGQNHFPLIIKDEKIITLQEVI